MGRAGRQSVRPKAVTRLFSRLAPVIGCEARRSGIGSEDEGSRSVPVGAVPGCQASKHSGCMFEESRDPMHVTVLGADDGMGTV